MKTIHCKHYSPRRAHSTHQSPHPARQMQTRHSTCLPPHSTHSRITHTEKKCKMAQGSKQVWGSRPRLKRNMPRLRKSRSRSEKSDPRSKKGIQGQKKEVRSKKSDPRSKKDLPMIIHRYGQHLCKRMLHKSFKLLTFSIFCSCREYTQCLPR